jgi:hypothetical protein
LGSDELLKSGYFFTAVIPPWASRNQFLDPTVLTVVSDAAVNVTDPELTLDFEEAVFASFVGTLTVSVL